MSFLPQPPQENPQLRNLLHAGRQVPRLYPRGGASSSSTLPPPQDNSLVGSASCRMDAGKGGGVLLSSLPSLGLSPHEQQSSSNPAFHGRHVFPVTSLATSETLLPPSSSSPSSSRSTLLQSALLPRPQAPSSALSAFSSSSSFPSTSLHSQSFSSLEASYRNVTSSSSSSSSPLQSSPSPFACLSASGSSKSAVGANQEVYRSFPSSSSSSFAVLPMGSSSRPLHAACPSSLSRRERNFFSRQDEVTLTSSSAAPPPSVHCQDPPRRPRDAEGQEEQNAERGEEEKDEDFKEFRGTLVWRRCLKCLDTSPDDVWRRLRDCMDLILEKGLKRLAEQVEEKTRISVSSRGGSREQGGAFQEGGRAGGEADPFLEVLRHPVIQKVATERVFLSNLALYRMWLDRYQVLAPPPTCQCGFLEFSSSSSFASSSVSPGNERGEALPPNEEDVLPADEEDKELEDSLAKRKEALALAEKKARQYDEEEEELQAELEKLVRDLVEQNRRNVRWASRLACEEKYLQGILSPRVPTSSSKKYAEFLERSLAQTESFASLIDDVKRRCGRLATIASCFANAASTETVDWSSSPSSPRSLAAHKKRGGGEERSRKQRRDEEDEDERGSLSLDQSASLRRLCEETGEQDDALPSSTPKKTKRAGAVYSSDPLSPSASAEVASPPGVRTPGLSVATPLTTADASPLVRTTSRRRNPCAESGRPRHVLGLSREACREREEEEEDGGGGRGGGGGVPREGEDARGREKERGGQQAREGDAVIDQRTRKAQWTATAESARRRNLHLSGWREGVGRRLDMIGDEEEKVDSSTPKLASFCRRAVTPPRTRGQGGPRADDSEERFRGTGLRVGDGRSMQRSLRKNRGTVGERDEEGEEEDLQRGSATRQREAEVCIHPKEGAYRPGAGKRQPGKLGEGPDSVIASQGSGHSSSLQDREDERQKEESNEEFLSVRGDDSPLRPSLQNPFSSLVNERERELTSPLRYSSSSTTYLPSLSKRPDRTPVRFQQGEDGRSSPLLSRWKEGGRSETDPLASLQGVCTPRRRPGEEKVTMASSFSVSGKNLISRTENTAEHRGAYSVPPRRKAAGDGDKEAFWAVRKNVLRGASSSHVAAQVPAVHSPMPSSLRRRKETEENSFPPVMKRGREEEKEISDRTKMLSKNPDGPETQRDGGAAAPEHGGGVSSLHEGGDDTHSSWIDSYLRRQKKTLNEY